MAFSAFSRHRRACRFLAGLLLAIGPATVLAHANDEAVLAEMRTRIDELRRQVLGSEDPAEQARLQKELLQTMDDSLARLSEKTRPMMTVALKIVTPLQTASAAYLNDAGEFFGSESGQFHTIRSREDIAARSTRVAELTEANKQLLHRIDSFEDDAARLLRDSKMSPVERRAFLHGMSESLSRQFGPMRAIRNLETKIYDRYRAALTLLDTEWGNWRADDKGVLHWDKPEAEQKFAAIHDEIQTLAARQNAAQQKLIDAR